MTKRVFISGSFDVLHSGHVAFLKEASTYGDVYVGVGCDKSIEGLKNRKTINPQQERLYMVRAIRYVKDAWINSGMGIHDFFEDMKKGSFDIMIVNEDQHSEQKQRLCHELEMEYIVLKRKPEPGLPVRSSTQMRKYYD